jgi:hypothetical protein
MQGVSRDIGSINSGARKVERKQDSETARASAQVKRASHRIRARNPRSQILLQQLGDVGARNDHAFVDIEPMFAQPCFPQEVCGWFSSPDSRIDERVDLARLVGG